MSIANVRAALETALSGMSPAISTVYENTQFTPTVGTPYQMAHLLPAEPNDLERGIVGKDQGIFQITLMYPLHVGTGDANARAELIRSTFYKKATFSAGGQNIIISKTPYIGQGVVDGDRWRVPVKITWFTN